MSEIEKILSQVGGIQDEVEELLKSIKKNKAEEDIELIKSKISEVSRILNESLVVLPSYERRKIQSNLQKYSADLTQAIDVKPKKFGFRRNVVESDIKKDVVDGELLKRETAKIERNIEQDINAVPKFVLEGLQNDQKNYIEL